MNALADKQFYNDQKLEKVHLFGKSFLWNSTLHQKLESSFYFTKKDDEPPKGFEKFFKKKEKRDQEDAKESESKQ